MKKLLLKEKLQHFFESIDNVENRFSVKNGISSLFHFLQKVIFADLTFITAITPKFLGGNDFYKTNHTKIHEIRPITPKSDWSYNHPL